MLHKREAAGICTYARTAEQPLYSIEYDGKIKDYSVRSHRLNSFVEGRTAELLGLRGISGYEIADDLAKLKVGQPIVGPKPAVGISEA